MGPSPQRDGSNLGSGRREGPTAPATRLSSNGAGRTDAPVVVHGPTCLTSTALRSPASVSWLGRLSLGTAMLGEEVIERSPAQPLAVSAGVVLLLLPVGPASLH